jgi:soluble lytic murein transglycosylase-like protein
MLELVTVLALEVGKKYNVEPELIIAVIAVESNFKPKAVGRSHGEIGLMQLRPEYFPTVTFDVRHNMELGVKHLANMKRLCYPKYGKAWYICYNLGPNKRIKHPTLFAYYRKVESAKTKIAENRRSVASSKGAISYAALSQ